MARRRLPLRLLALCLTLGTAALPTSAGASGFQLIEQNASGLGNAFAGQAAGVRDASAIYFNPAALTRIKGWNVVVSLEPIGIDTTFNNDLIATTPPSLGPLSCPVAQGTSGGNAGKWTPVPNGYVSAQVADRVFVGVGLNVPFGLETSWDPNWVGRFHATNSKVHVVNVNPTVAFKVNDFLSLGAGVDYQHLTADLGQRVAYGGISYVGALAAAGSAAAAGILAQMGGPSGLAIEGPALISGSSNAWGWNAGALAKLGEQGHFGVSYRSKVSHDVSGTVTFQDAPQFAETGPLGPLGAAINSQFADSPVQTTIDLPYTVSLAAGWNNEKVELLADWTYTGWDSIQSLDITRVGATTPFTSVPLAFENTWRAGLGGNVKLNDEWTLRLGTAYDKAPVQDLLRTPRLPDNNRIWAAAGFQWKIRDRARVDVGYAHLFIKDASSDLPNQAAANATPKGTLVGFYNEKVDILGVQLSLQF